MKKGNRVLAMFLAAVMLVTSIAWDFSDTSVAEAAETESNETVDKSHVKYDFMNMEDMSVLNDNFTSYLQGAEADEYATDSWFVGKEATDAIDTDTSNKEGLKTRKKGSIYYLMHNDTYENFLATIKFDADANVCIVVGDVGTTAGPSQNDGACMFWVSGSSVSLVNYKGAGKNTNLNWTSGNKAELTLNIRVENRVLTVWIDEVGVSTSFPVNDAFPTESKICLRQRRDAGDSTGMHGCYQSLEIIDLDAEGYTNFDNIDVATLGDKGYTSTRFTRPGSGNPYVLNGEEDQLVSNHWFTGMDYTATYKNAGLKPDTTGADNMTHLNTPYIYKNFKVSAEIYWGYNAGIVIGEKNVYPNDSSASAIRINFTGTSGQLRVIGAVDYDSATPSGTNAKWSVSGSGTSAYGGFTFTNASLTKGEAYTLNVEMKDGVLSVWVDEYDGVLTVKVADTYPTDGSSIALLASKYEGDGGGFKSLDVQNLSDTYISFDNIDVATLGDKGYTSTRFTRPGSGNPYVLNGEEDQLVSNHWFSGTDYSTTYINAGLKPNTTGSDNMTHLNIPNTYKNFRMSAEIYWGYNAGIVIGEKNVYPNDSSASAIRINFTGTSGQLRVIGAVDYDSATPSGTNAKWSVSGSGTSAYGGFTFTNASLTKGEAYTLNVEMKDGVLSVWVDGYDGVLTVKVADTYPTDGSSIALLASKYEGDGGGLKSCVVQEINTLSKIYTPKEFATYRTETNSDGSYTTLPEYNNYLFAGWFYDEECTENVAKNVTAVTRPVYAKFVSEDILTVKAQISATLEDEKADNDDPGEIRFITTVDSLKYSEVGFVIAYDKDRDGVDTPVPFSSNEVYKELYAVGSSEGEAIKYYPHEEFCPSSTYFKACTVRKIGQDYYDMDFTVTPFWITSDGTRVEGEVAVKSIDERWVRNAVYISNNGSDDTGLGTPNRPYVTVNNAINQVRDGGTIYVQGAYEVESEFVWDEHGKQVTISGTTDEATLSFANVLNGTSTTIRVKDDVTFSDITLGFTTSGNQNILANGHDFVVKESVTFTGNPVVIYGGGDSNLVVDSTYLELHAGDYTEIYGGGSSGNVKYDTEIIIGSKVNSSVGSTSHDETSYLVFGGVRNGTVKGNTNITVMEGANFHYIFGGSRDGGSVDGSTNIKFAGNTYGIYGGSWNGTVSDTHVEILGGTAAQVFGGCRETSMTGNTDVKLLGGTITRRVFGGCYNAFGTSWADTIYQVTGHTSVTIGPEVQITLTDSDSDRGVFAGSRYKEALEGEKGTVIFIGGCFDDKNGVLGRDANDYTNTALGDVYTGYILESPNEYNYLVKATAGGTVTSSNGLLYVTPETNYTVTVTYGESNTVITANEDGTYTLPPLADKDSKTTITVTFNK